MNRFEVYNLALNILNIEPLEEGTDISRSSDDPVVKTLNGFYGTALRKASREHDWSFLMERIVLADDMGPEAGYSHSYRLPDNLFRLCHAEGGDYRRFGDTLATNGDPVIYCITMDTSSKGDVIFGNDSLIPDDFWELVAYQLAIHASVRLTAGDAKTQTIATLYNSLRSTLVMNDIHHESKIVEHTCEVLEGYGL